MPSIPMRSEERVGHPSAVQAADRVEMQGEVIIPTGHPAWHPVAANWYKSLAVSGQSKYYEPSDWATAVFATDLMDTILRQEEPNASLLGQWVNMVRPLMVMEGDRRRVRMEIERTAREEARANLPAGRQRINSRRLSIAEAS